MGCGSSSTVPPYSDLNKNGIKFVQKKTGISDQDIAKLYKMFVKIDLTESGLVEFDEFCSRVKCEPTVFLQSLFSFFGSVVDKTSSGNIKMKKLNFPEFALFLCFFLTLNEAGLGQYLYKVLTDDDYNATLTAKEKESGIYFAKQIKLLFGSQGSGSSGWANAEKILKQMDSNNNGKISKNEFEMACHKNKSLVFPIFSYQLDLKTKIVGAAFWNSKQGLGNDMMVRIGKIRTELHEVLRNSGNSENVNGIELEF